MTTTRVALLLTLAGGVALCSSPRPAGAGGEATFGGQWWTQNEPEAKYREFRDLPRGGFLESFVLSGRHGDDAWLLVGTHALRNDQSTRLTWTNASRWRADVSVTRIPHLFSQVARSPYVEVSPGVFLLPDSLQAANQRNPGAYTAVMFDLMKSAPPVGLGFDTEVGKARLRGRPAPGWQVEVAGVRRERSGRKAWGTPLGFSSAIELWEPIDQRTIDADVRASYQRERVTVQASAGLSAFENRVTRLRWDNPLRVTDTTYGRAYVAGDGTSAGQTALYPDNRVIRGSLALGLRLPENSALTASVGFSQVTQDETDWLPVTVNSALRPDTIPLPGVRTDGKADVLTEKIQLVTRAVPKLTGTFRYHGYRYDNKTPVWRFPTYSRLDQTLEPAVTSRPFGNEQRTLGVDFDYDLASRVDVGGVYEFRQREHTLREVEEDTEHVYGASVRARPLDGVSLHARYRRGEREMDAFHPEHYQRSSTDTTLIEQPGLRRYDVADRTRDEIAGGAAWAVGGRVELSGGWSYAKDDYTGSRYGLREDEQHMVTADAAVHAHERLDLHGGWALTQTKARQTSNESGSTVTADVATDWVADIKDLNTFAYAGAEWFAAPDRLSFSTRYEMSRDFAGYRLSNTARTAQDVPTTRYLRHDAVVEASYQLFPDTRVTGRYGWTQFDVEDFAAKDVPLITGAAAAIYLGDFYRDFRAHRVALLVKHAF